jgi:hypothetical protein
LREPAPILIYSVKNHPIRSEKNDKFKPESGKEGAFPPPSHTTGHAGPHPAVHELYRALAG